MASHLYNTGRCLQLRLFNRLNFGVHFTFVTCHFSMGGGGDGVSCVSCVSFVFWSIFYVILNFILYIYNIR